MTAEERTTRPTPRDIEKKKARTPQHKAYDYQNQRMMNAGKACAFMKKNEGKRQRGQAAQPHERARVA